MTEQRYVVRKVTGMCLGVGGFVVADTLLGTEGVPHLFKDKAEREAMQRNWHERMSAEEMTTTKKEGVL